MRTLMVGAAVAAYLGTAGMAAADGMYEGSMKDAPEPIAPVMSWTGFYIGGGVGAGAVVHELDVNAYENGYDHEYCSYSESKSSYSCSGSPSWSSTANLNFDGIGGEGIFGTVQIGYDWQFSPRGVFGFFADADLSGIETELDFSAGTDGDTWLSGNGEVAMDWMWTIGARLGFLTTPDTLFYALIGYSQAQFDDPRLTVSYEGENGFAHAMWSLSSPESYSSSETYRASLDTFSGITVGVGMETRLDRNWGLKLEYRFTQFSDEELFSVSGPGRGEGCGEVCIATDDGYMVDSGISADLEPSLHTGRVVLTYRFGERHEPLESLK